MSDMYCHALPRDSKHTLIDVKFYFWVCFRRTKFLKGIIQKHAVRALIPNGTCQNHFTQKLTDI